MSNATPDFVEIRKQRRAVWLAGIVFGEPRSESGHRTITVRQTGSPPGPIRIREGRNSGEWSVERYDPKDRREYMRWKLADPKANSLPLDSAKAVAARMLNGLPMPPAVSVDYNGTGESLKREHPARRLYGPDPMASARARVRAAGDNPASLFPAGVLTIRTVGAADPTVSMGENNAMPAATKTKRENKASKEQALREQRENGAQPSIDEAAARLAEDTTPEGTADVPADERPAELSDAAVRAIQAAVTDATGKADEAPADVTPDVGAQVWAYVKGDEDPAASEAHRITTATGDTAETSCGQTIELGTVAHGSYAVCAYCADGTTKPADAPAAAPIKNRGPVEAAHVAETDALKASVAGLIATLTAEPNATDARALYDILSAAVGEVRPMLKRAATATDGGSVRVRNASPLKLPVRYTSPDGTVTDMTCSNAARAAAKDYASPACVEYVAKADTVSLNARLFLKRDLRAGKLTNVTILDEAPAADQAAG
jgi:hypothetical protein